MATKHTTKTTTKVVVGKETRDGREVWRVSQDGRIQSITTHRSSSKSLDEGMVIYDRALKSLANR